MSTRPGPMSLLARWFGQGLLVLVPLGGTIWLVWSVVSGLDAALGAPFPGFGVLVVVPTILLVGFLSANVAGAWAFRLFERALERLPLVRIVHGAIKDLMSAFVGDKKSFGKPVLALLDARGDVAVIGFQTADEVPGLPGHVGVYLPQAYNFAGNVIVVPADRVRALDADPAAVMSFVVSGGVGRLPTRAEQAGQRP